MEKRITALRRFAEKARKDFLFKTRLDLVYGLRGKVLTGKERLKIQDTVRLIEQGLERVRKRVGVTV